MVTKSKCCAGCGATPANKWRNDGCTMARACDKCAKRTRKDWLARVVDRDQDAKHEAAYRRADDAALFLTPTISALLRAHWQRLTGTADDPPADYMNEASARIIDAMADVATETLMKRYERIQARRDDTEIKDLKNRLKKRIQTRRDDTEIKDLKNRLKKLEAQVRKNTNEISMHHGRC